MNAARRFLIATSLAVAVAGWCGLADTRAAIELQPVASGLVRPVAITHAGDGSGRLFITLQAGKIVVLDGAQVLATPFLDITPLVGSANEEQGLLSVAFHPQYASNGWFFVNYTDLAGDTVVARYHVSVDPNVGDTSSAATVLKIRQPFANHNGGQLQFGPMDGYLYIGMGDGGSGGDPNNNAQNPLSLLGKLVRIDVDHGAPYTIPPTNPFFGSASVSNEIWAVGLRNPWRFSFDRATHDLFIGDVGQDAREEVDFQPANSGGGENYGWRRMEGLSCFNPSSGCNDGTLTLPVLQYDHSQGCAIVGGYRYRGAQQPALDSVYLYGDHCAGRIWGAMTNSSGGWTSVVMLDGGPEISSFGEGEDGEVYVSHYTDGAVLRIADTPPPIATNDLAIIRIKAPKRINLPAAGVALTKRIKVQIQNRSTHTETINSLTGLVTIVAESLGTNCPNAIVTLINGSPNTLPRTVKSKGKLNVFFNVTYDCANDSLKGVGHEDFRYLATVNRAAIDGNADAHPADDICPRSPQGLDPNPDGTITDNGCGGKTPGGTLGADVLTDVVVK